MSGFFAKGLQWPAAIVGMLLLNVGVCAVTVTAALRDPASSAVESDYYRKAVDWDADRAAWSPLERVGWTARARLVGGRLRVEVTDRNGDPVTLEHGRAEVFHRADPGARVGTALDGFGFAEVAPERAGFWTVRVWLESGGVKSAGELELRVE